MEFSSLFSGAIIGSFITVVIGTSLSGYLNMRAKDKEYKNSYSKMILEKRVFSYEQLNHIINLLYTSTIDESDSKAYHIVFDHKDDFDIFFERLYSTSSIKFWLSDKTNNNLKKIFEEFVMCSSLISNGKSIISIGKKEYRFIAELRDNLETSLLNDMKELHNIDKFFKEKEIKTGFIETNLSKRPEL